MFCRCCFLPFLLRYFFVSRETKTGTKERKNRCCLGDHHDYILVSRLNWKSFCRTYVSPAEEKKKITITRNEDDICKISQLEKLSLIAPKKVFLSFLFSWQLRKVNRVERAAAAAADCFWQEMRRLSQNLPLWQSQFGAQTTIHLKSWLIRLFSGEKK